MTPTDTPIKTETLPFDTAEAIEAALAQLQRSQAIAAPTDTVYGLMCQYTNTTAIERLYEIKGRPPAKAIPVLLESQEQLPQVAQMPVSAQATLLMENFWPGPLTIILRAVPGLPTILTSGQETIAVRVPDHSRLRVLLNVAGPLAATSANRSAQPETHSASEVLVQLDGRLPLLLDGCNQQPTAKVSLASTIVDLSSPKQSIEPPRILRAGPLEAQVRALLGQT